MSIFIFFLICCAMVAVIFNYNPQAPKAEDVPEVNKDKPKILFFKSNQAAFEYTCKYMDCTLKEGAMIPALIVDVAPKHENGNQNLKIKVASDDGGFDVIAFTIDANLEDLKAGDFVLWKAAATGLENITSLRMAGWTGCVLTKLEPALDIHNGWIIYKNLPIK